jgi:MerR family transcriptional regulator/heat shock protein HspR
MPDPNTTWTRTDKVGRINRIRLKPSEQDLAVTPAKQEQPATQERDAPRRAEEFQGVYIISVAARLLEMHPQTLRKYERLGLVQPSRTFGMLRLYSDEDLQKLRLIRHLEENLGLNLAGVDFTLTILQSLLDMMDRISRLNEAEEFFQMLEEEMTEVFRRLNLPVPE